MGLTNSFIFISAAISVAILDSPSELYSGPSQILPRMVLTKISGIFLLNIPNTSLAEYLGANLLLSPIFPVSSAFPIVYKQVKIAPQLVPATRSKTSPITNVGLLEILWISCSSLFKIVAGIMPLTPPPSIDNIQYVLLNI